MTDFSLRGINLAIATPFRDDGSIDFERFETLIEQYLDAGIHGILLSSGTGLHVYLSDDEYKQLVAFGCNIIAKRATVIVQTSDLRTEDVVARTRYAQECGADAVMVLPPYFEGPTDDDSIVDFYAEVGAVGLPIVGYNVPHVVGVEITPDLLRRLCAIPNFYAVKDSSGDFAKQAALIQTGLPVLNGADPFMLYSLYAGVEGVIWGGANFAPKTCVRLFQAAENGQWAEARRLWHALEQPMNLIWNGPYGPSVYAAADIMDYGAGVQRKPFSPLPEDKVSALHAALTDLSAQECGN